VAYVIPEHEKLVHNVCEPGLFGDIATQNIMAVLVRGMHKWHEYLCGALEFGAAWPDCPTAPEKANMKTSCWRLPGLGVVPFHAGMFEMGKQAAQGLFNSVPEPLPDFRAYEMSSVRDAIQHEHASPLLPLHLPQGHIALTSNRQFRAKMVQQALEWHCKASYLIHRGLHLRYLPKSTHKPHEQETLRIKRKQLVMTGLAFAGKILHMIGDSFSMSHARRKLEPTSSRAVYLSAEKRALDHKPATDADLEIMRKAQIEFAYTMDDVDWGKHKAWDTVSKSDRASPDSDKRVMLALAHVATRHVLGTLSPLFDGLSDKVPSASLMEKAQESGDEECAEAVHGAIPREGWLTWGTSCKCPRGTVVTGDHKACKDSWRKFRAASLKGKGCKCEDQGWSGVCFAILQNWTHTNVEDDCSMRGGMKCHDDADQHICLPSPCQGQEGFVMKNRIHCEGDVANWPTEAGQTEKSRTDLGHVLCNDIFNFEDLDGGAGGSSADVGRNGNASNWRAELPADEETREKVATKLKDIIDGVEALRMKGHTMSDKKIPFRYPGPNDIDICERVEEVQCRELLKEDKVQFAMLEHLEEEDGVDLGEDSMF
jgi:hypothetical protein